MSPGGHFYLQAGRKAVLHDVVARLREYVSGRPPSVRRFPIAARELRAS